MKKIMIKNNVMVKIIVLIFIFSLSFLSSSCDDEENGNMITENATLFYYFDAGFGTSQCDFVIETQSNKIFIPDASSNLFKFTSDNANDPYTDYQAKNKVKISYILTDDIIERCFHREGFLESPTIVIEIKEIKKI